MGSRRIHQMKMLITGGNRGLGQFLSTTFSADSISRSTGLDITEHAVQIAERSLNYDVFVNNAFDGPPHKRVYVMGVENPNINMNDLEAYAFTFKKNKKFIGMPYKPYMFNSYSEVLGKMVNKIKKIRI